jgi:type I restriction enzyme S subunit
MNKGDFEAINVLTPERNLRDEYTRLVANMFDGALNNAEQNKELTALRDWLLPMLMNGQVTVTAEDRS